MSTKKYSATLLRGERYSLARADNGGELVFTKGVGRVISAATFDYLSEAAVDSVIGEVSDITGEREIIHRAKFDYEEYDGELDVGSPVVAVEKPRRLGVVPAPKPRNRVRKEA